MMETVRSSKPKILSIWPFTEDVCRTLSMFSSCFSDNCNVKLPDLVVKNIGHLDKQQISDKQ